MHNSDQQAKHRYQPAVIQATNMIPTKTQQLS